MRPLPPPTWRYRRLRSRPSRGEAPGGCRTRDGVVFTAPTRVPECPLPRRCISRSPPDWDGRRDRLLPWSWWRALPGMDSRGRGNDGGRGFGVIRVMGEIGMIGTWMGRMDADEGRAGDWIQAPYRRTGQACAGMTEGDSGLVCGIAICLTGARGCGYNDC